MIVDFDDAGQKSEPFEADVCIIGTGAAGVTIAREFIAEGRDVLLLESGGLDHEDDIQELMAGDQGGYPYYPLDDCRLRFFGGTTAIWGGRCAQLNVIDFEKRSWVDYSGWPYSKEALLKYYHRAQVLLGLEETAGEDELWEPHKLKRPKFDPKIVSTAFWQFDTMADRFASHQSSDLLSSPKATILLHATVTNIVANGDGTAIDNVKFSNLAGDVGRARAKNYVLATGGIENARILLASNGVQKNGLGNDKDLVGRFFMEHPHARGGKIVSKMPYRLLKMLPRSYRFEGQRYAAVGLPAAELQEKEGILNGSFTISPRQAPDEKMALSKKVFMKVKHDMRPSQSRRALWHIYRNLILWAREEVGPAVGSLEIRRGGLGLYTIFRSEQSPNPESRVVLSQNKDSLGGPKSQLNWNFNEIDKRTVDVMMTHLDSELRRLGMGTAEKDSWLLDDSLKWKTDPLISSHPIGGYHHMGTTRMAHSPNDGVVDEHCKVHGLGNLYVAGSSVFPTSGWANPTLTIIALALKLADHLKIKDPKAAE